MNETKNTTNENVKCVNVQDLMEIIEGYTDSNNKMVVNLISEIIELIEES